MLAITFALLAVVPAQGDGFPLDSRLRWTYVRGSSRPVTVEVAGTKTIAGERVTVLSVVGEWVFAYDNDWGTYVTSEGGGLAAHGCRYRTNDKPLMFVPPKLEIGSTWHASTVTRSSDSDRRDRIGFEGTVLDREEVTVPAGTFDAWKIRVSNDRDAPATARDFTAWFVPGVGFVKYEYRYNSYPWNGFLDAPIVYRLSKCGKRPYGYPIEYPALSPEQNDIAERLLASLEHEDSELNRSAERALAELGPGVIPQLLQYLDADPASHLQARIRALIQRFTTIEITGSTTRARGRVGELLPVTFRIRNVGRAPIPVAPALDGSDWGRYPSYTIEVRDPAGRLVNVERPVGCGNINPLREQDIVVLQPGDELDPIRGDGFSHYMLSRWKPMEPGTYTVRCIYEAAGVDPTGKENRYPRWGMYPGAPTLRSLVDRMPQGRMASNEVSITIEH